MAYTLNYFYNKFLTKIDKEGSDLYSLSIIMEFLETSIYDFIEQTVKFSENTQTLKDFLRPLQTPYDILLTTNPVNTEEMLATLPSNYLMLETAKVLHPTAKVRTVTIYRKGELNINELNPNKRPTTEYPSVFQYQDYLSVLGSSTFTKIQGFYIAKPVFGDINGNLDIEITVNLPDNTLEKIMNLMATAIHSKEGDQRYQLSLNQEQSFGKSYK